MKKLSALIAMLLCVTIGGVYAAWTYAGTNDIADVYYETKVTIADVQLTGANGTYKIESNLVITVDQRDANHYAKLVYGSNNDSDPYLKVTFTPSANAPDDVKKNAVDSELYFGYSTTTPMQYKIDEYGNYSESGTPINIFVLNPTSNGNLDKNIDWVKESDGTFTYTLQVSQIENMIKLNVFTVKVEGSTTGETIEDTFRLDTKAEHDAFLACLTGNIYARVTDGSVN